MLMYLPTQQNISPESKCYKLEKELKDTAQPPSLHSDFVSSIELADNVPSLEYKTKSTINITGQTREKSRCEYLTILSNYDAASEIKLLLMARYFCHLTMHPKDMRRAMSLV